MQEFRHKRGGVSLPRFALALFGLASLGVAAFVSLRATWGMYGKLLAAADEERAAQIQLAQLTAQQQKIVVATENLASPRGIEAEVRARYGVVRPGEGEIRIVAVQSPATSTSSGSEGFWQRLWHALRVW